MGGFIDFLPLPKQYGEMNIKMQGFEAKIKDFNQQILQIKKKKSIKSAKSLLLTLVLLLVGCGETAVSTPTPIQNEPLPTTAATPTLIPEPTAVPSASPNTSPSAPPLATEIPPFAGLSIGDPYAPELGNLGYDVTDYDLILALDPAVENIDATVHISGVVTDPTLNTLSLDFVGFEVAEVLLDGSSVTFSRFEDKLIIEPTMPFSEGQNFTLSVTYAGNPVERPSPYVGFAASVGMSFVDGQSIYVLSEPDGSRYWFPNNDHPRDKATYRFEITVPVGLNGRCQRPAHRPN